MLPTTRKRVRSTTAEKVNRRIDDQIRENIACFADATQDQIDRRLAELDAEWDVERYLETMAPTITLTGLALGVMKDRKWLLLPALVQSFFLLHALQGWCPPLPMLRRLGIRTADEINRERYALKAIRGDFSHVCDMPSFSDEGRVEAALDAVGSY